MPSLNKVILIGHLGGDPELRYTADGKAVANFSLATSFGKDKKTEWHKIIVWEKSAEFVRDYCHKGSLVYVEGRIQTRDYEKDDVKKYITEIIAYTVLSLGGKSTQEELPMDGGEIDDDDLPF